MRSRMCVGLYIGVHVSAGVCWCRRDCCGCECCGRVCVCAFAYGELGGLRLITQRA